MKKLLIGLFSVAMFLTSCSEQFLVKGTSNVQALEGKMLYLKVFKDDDMHTLDSSRVVHGRFKFGGVMDSVMMANVFLEGSSVMPLVLEDGEVTLKIEDMVQVAAGTPMNDTLSAFIRRKAQIDARLAELPHMESQMIMDGLDHDVILRDLREKARELHAENDKIVTRFISDNYNNVLGPGVFMILTSGLQYPVLNPQIEAIVSQATPYFLNNPYVKEYLKVAEQNMEKLREY